MGTIKQIRERRLSNRMKQEAVGLGLCAQWTEEWRKGTTRDDMVEKFVTGLDFCIQHDWPSVEVMKRDFGDVMHNHGVYADEAVSLKDPKTVVLNGRCNASITSSGFAVSNIYVRHTSRLKLTVTNMAYVHVSVYDNAIVEIHCEGNAKCFVYKYGGSVNADGNIVIRNRE